MEKRLTTTAMLFSVGFLFMLVCAVGAFFYGVKIGSDKIEAKYAAEEEAKSAGNAATFPYQQQDLVSFYLTVYSPYRDFQNEWLNAADSLAKGDGTDSAARFKGLAKLARQKAEEASSFDMGKSPLLGDAQHAYIRSLKYFEEAADAASKAAKSAAPDDLRNTIQKNKAYQSAVKESLSAQKAYFASMQKWAASVDPTIPDDAAAATEPLQLKEWSKLPLVVKNRIIADYMAARNELYGFYPHDMASSIDEFIRSGQAANMKLQTLNAVADLLLNTKAVRTGDYASVKSRLYAEEMLPQLPFFYPEPD